MKLVIQLPCYNEEKQLPITLPALPKKIEGVEDITILVIDDGSEDRTVDVAKKYGIKNFVLIKHSGYGRAFVAGLKKSLELGADIIVNTDGDNQYCADDIAKLIKPILEKKADIVIGERPILQMEQFSFTKKCLQKIGTFFVCLTTSVEVKDATSGFRAFTKDSAVKLDLHETYTVSMETIVQASAKGLKIISVPIRTNPDLRKSRLMKNSLEYIIKQTIILLRSLFKYRPYSFFAILSVLFLLGILCFYGGFKLFKVLSFYIF